MPPPSSTPSLLQCPALLLLVLLLLLTHILITVWRVSERVVSVSHRDLAAGEWWRALLAPLCHSSTLHVTLVSGALLYAAEAERAFGSLYFVKYSLVLVLVQRAVSVGVVQWLVTRHGTLMQHYTRLLVAQRSQGATSLAFAWLGVLSFRHPARAASLLGFATVSHAYLPVLLLLVFQVAMPRSPFTTVDCTMGLLTGYALSLGVLEVLPEDSVYWTVCFLLDVSLACLHAAFRNTATSSSSSSSSSGSSSSSTTWTTRSDGGVDESLLPLMRPDDSLSPSLSLSLVTMKDLQVQIVEPDDSESSEQSSGYAVAGLDSVANMEDDLERALRMSRSPHVV